MAYVGTDKKAKIAAALKAVMPKGWKYSLAVRHHSRLVCTIASAPVDMIAECLSHQPEQLARNPQYVSVNPYHYKTSMAGSQYLPVVEQIMDALNTDNHDRSDLQSDHHDVGHYVDLQFGRWDKPFQVKA